jgi:hypothetical protein
LLGCAAVRNIALAPLTAVFGQPRPDVVIMMMDIDDVGWPGAILVPEGEPAPHADDVVAGYSSGAAARLSGSAMPGCPGDVTERRHDDPERAGGSGAISTGSRGAWTRGPA